MDENQERKRQAVNPNRKSTEDTRTPEELLAVIESKGREVATVLAALRNGLLLRLILPAEFADHRLPPRRERLTEPGFMIQPDYGALVGHD